MKVGLVNVLLWESPNRFTLEAREIIQSVYQESGSSIPYTAIKTAISSVDYR